MIKETVRNRKQTAFRLDEDLLNYLRAAARRENRSLNNYVESILMDIVYKTSQENTSEKTSNMDNRDSFVASVKKVAIQKTVLQNKTTPKR
jgi:hypothetical protein